MSTLLLPILVIVIISNFILGIVILSRGLKDKINFLFGFLCFGLALWSFGILGFYLIELPFSSSWIILTHSSAAFLALIFLYFTFNFPSSIIKNKLVRFLPIVPFVVIISFLFFTKNIIGDIFDYKYEIGPGYIFYNFYMISYFWLGYLALYLQHKKAAGAVQKAQVKYVFIGAVLASIPATITDLVFPFFGIFYYNWLGPAFTLFLVGSIAYAILKHHLFNIKVIITELLTFAIWIFLLARTLLSETLREWIINGGLFVAIVFFGVLLIRSVIKEVELRERVRRAYEVEKRAKEEIQRITEAKTQFIMATQHHLRTPLTSMIGYLDLLFGGTYGKVPLKLKTTLLKFQVSTKRLIRVVNTLLDISQFQLGKKVVSLKSGIQFESLIKEVIEELQFEFKIRNLYLNYEKKGKVPAIKADPEKLKVALFNIIDNGIKYTQEGGLKLRLEKIGSNVQLSIKDTGMGIKPDQAKKLFKQAFSRGAGAKKAYGLGRGIGLYVTAHIIKGHNGRIWAESEGKGKGSTFFIELPVG